eukprot:15391071-Alexandrium_andersonii.AAC.1
MGPLSRGSRPSKALAQSSSLAVALTLRPFSPTSQSAWSRAGLSRPRAQMTLGRAAKETSSPE